MEVEGADEFNFALALLRCNRRWEARAPALRARELWVPLGEPSLIAQVDALLAACGNR